MKKLFVCIITAAYIGQAVGQDNHKLDLKIADLTTPTSPGFILADKAPASINKPTTPKALALNVLNLWEGGAVEVTPYWLTPKPNLTFDRYYNKSMPVLQTFNLSVGTFKTDTTSTVSAGAKFQLFRIFSAKAKAPIFAIKDSIVNLLSEIDPDKLNVAAIKKYNAQLRELVDVSQAQGLFIMEVAGALLASSNNNSYKHLSTSRSGVWANLRWAPYFEKRNTANPASLSVIALARYAWNNNVTVKANTDSAFLDYGLSLSFQKARFDLSVEYVNRRDVSIKKSYDRFAFIANYMISENIYLVSSFGKNFDNLDDIIAIFGVKFALSKERITAD